MPSEAKAEWRNGYHAGLATRKIEAAPLAKAWRGPPPGFTGGQSPERPCGPMDKASVYATGDSRFESWQGQLLHSSVELNDWLSPRRCVFSSD